MTLFAFGISHKSASVALREKVALSEEILSDASSELKRLLGAQALVLFSTCNRTEIYGQADAATKERLVKWMAEFHSLSQDELHPVCYYHEQEQAVTHLMQVASGLDSLVLGEPQVLGQVKQAFQLATEHGSVNTVFQKCFQQTFATAKKIRTTTGIGESAVSVAYAAVQLAKHIFASIDNSHVLLIGAGETIELVARHLLEQNVSSVTVANRTIERAQGVAKAFNAQAITLGQIPDYLSKADIVFSSTASQLPILGKGMVEKALKARRYKPMFLVDLAVPRDIESEVGSLSDAYLYSVDDLQHIVENNLQSRKEAAEQAQLIIQEQVESFWRWCQSQHSIDLVKVYRANATETKDKLVERAVNQLASGADPEAIILELANKLTNNLIHRPTQALKSAAEQQNQTHLSLLSQALGLDEE